MKSMDELILPEAVFYSKEHLWVNMEGKSAVIGITDYAQDQLGEIVYVELPSPDSEIRASDPFGVVESIKTVSDLYAPVSGKVASVNDSLESEPEMVNSAPHGGGWMIRVELSQPSEIDRLMSRDEYSGMLEGRDS